MTFALFSNVSTAYLIYLLITNNSLYPSTPVGRVAALYTGAPGRRFYLGGGILNRELYMKWVLITWVAGGGVV